LRTSSRPIGTERLEEFLDHQWGSRAPRTYKENLSITKDFFQWQVKRGRLHGDPTLLIERAKSREVYRTSFTSSQRRAILAGNDSLRDSIALRLLLDYGLRKGSVRAVQPKSWPTTPPITTTANRFNRLHRKAPAFAGAFGS
jgi:site-specific recombinase XerD